MKTQSLTIDSAPTELATRFRSADTTLAAMAALALFMVLAAPTRFFFVPFTYEGDFQSMVPPSLIDLIWFGLGLALYARSGRPSPWVPLALAGLVTLGAIAIAISGADAPEILIDLVTFNCRLIGGLVVGVLLARAGIKAGLLVVTLMAGVVVIAVSTIVLAAGTGPSYEFYTQMQRYGGMGLGPNEAAIVFAGSFNMLPALFRRRPWLALTAPLLIAALLYTGSRTGVLIAAAGVVLWIPAAARSAKGFKGVVLWIMVLGLAALAAWVGELLIQGMLNRGGVTVANRLDTTSDVSTAGRLEIYAGVPAYLWQHRGVLLIGVGACNAAVEWFLQNAVGLGTMHTHDLILQLVTAYGVTGIVLAAILIVPLLRRSRRFPDDDARALRWFGLTLVAGQVIQYGLFEVKFLLIFTMTVGFIATATRRPTLESGA